jgi:hypothetical protein
LIVFYRTPTTPKQEHSMRTILATLALSILSVSGSSFACDESGNRTQRVYASSEGVRLKDWVVTSSEIEAIEMPNGFKLGISIEPASPAKYASLKSDHVPELVRIALFDMASEGNPQELTYTWGGANSIQGYGARGGADRVDQLGQAGITLTLLHPVCVQARTLAHTQ